MSKVRAIHGFQLMTVELGDTPLKLDAIGLDCIETALTTLYGENWRKQVELPKQEPHNEAEE